VPQLDYHLRFKIVFLTLASIIACVILTACEALNLPGGTSTSIPIPAPSLVIRPSSTPETLVQPTNTTAPTGTNGTVVAIPIPTLVTLDFRKFFPAVPPGMGKVYNHLIFFSNVSGKYLVYQINLDGSGFTQLSQFTDQDVYDMEPAWSPDGRIAFTSKQADGRWEIFILYPDRPLPVQLTSLGADCWSLGWSPDGKYLTFVSNATQDEEIYLISADGGTPLNLTQRHDANDFLPVWSPDGQHIMFVSNREEGVSLDIYVMKIDGSEVTRLTATSQARNTSPNWSPDGSKIAFVSDRDGNFEVYVMGYPEGTEANGGTPTRLTNTPQYEWSPTWSPDGKYIAFTSLRDNNKNYQVYIMAPDGSNQTRLTNDAGDDIIPRWWP
jgi:Tol biopolymer transport system component